MTDQQLTIGELGRATGTKIETIRYYERIGLLPPPPRTGAGNYRSYTKNHLGRLSFVRRSRDLGFTLGVTRRLLPFGDQIAALRWLSGTWWAVIPASAVAVGLLGALVGGFIGGLLAAAYNRSPRHASVVVELPDGADALEAGAER